MLRSMITANDRYSGTKNSKISVFSENFDADFSKVGISKLKDIKHLFNFQKNKMYHNLFLFLGGQKDTWMKFVSLMIQTTQYPPIFPYGYIYVFSSMV